MSDKDAVRIPSERAGKQRSVGLVETQEPALVPYDEHLLERARTQWQFGDWDSLVKYDRDTLQHHPERAKLALYVAAALFQTGASEAAKQFIGLARDWGISRKNVSQILIAGIHNSLGRAVAVSGNSSRALNHFESAIVIGLPGCDARLLTQARINEQIAQLGLSQQLNDHKLSLGHIRQTEVSVGLAVKVRECIQSADVHESVDKLVASKQLTSRDLILFYVELADQFAQRKDKLTALHFLQTARDQVSVSDESLNTLLIQKFISLGKADMAADIAFQASVVANKDLHLNQAEKDAIKAAYDKNRQTAQAKSEHGHDLLLSYLKAHIKAFTELAAERVPVIIEIGTTRENVPGQGSTRKIAEFCKQHKLKFITVDMDPHNTRMAAAMFASMGVPFEAITQKGEDYLLDYEGTFDFIFLDAYDFDHGQHSGLRQSRYKQFLGGPIDEALCHQMHLDCAKSVVSKLSKDGVVCFDDTWLSDGKWTAKGTTAMPYLLENGFKLLEARNRAALLARVLSE